MILSLTIDRTSLALAPLVISNNPFGADFWLPEDGMGEVATEYRRTYMPESRYSHGRELLGVTLAPASIPVTVYTQGASMADLAANKTALRNALGQFDYTIAQDIDGVSVTYRAEPVVPTWGTLDSGKVRARIATTSVVIPLHPVPVA